MTANLRKLPFPIPALEAVHPPYAALVAKRNELWNAREAAKGKLRQCHETLRLNSQAPTATPVAESADEVARKARVAKLLGTTQLDVGKQSTSDTPSPGTAAAEAAALSREIADIDDALDTLAPALRRERYAASDVLCRTIKPEFDRLMQRLVTAVLELHKANAEFALVSNHMLGNEVAWSALNPVAPKFAGEPTATYGEVAVFLHEAEASGWLKPGQMPAEFA